MRVEPLDAELGELYEPFNPQSRVARWFEPPEFFLHIDETNEQPFVGPIAQMAALRYPLLSRLTKTRSLADGRAALDTWRRVGRYRREGRSVLVKDPIALFSTPWLHERFGFRPVILVRHPCGFVSSVLRIGWTINFASWLRQDRLMETLLAPWRAEIEAAAERGTDALLDSALFWRACTGVITGYRDRYPEWVVLRHEDLALDPERKFAELYGTLGLRWSDAVAAQVIDATNADNPGEAETGVQHTLARDSRAVTEVWRTRLSADQVATVREVTADVSDNYYPDDTW